MSVVFYAPELEWDHSLDFLSLLILSLSVSSAIRAAFWWVLIRWNDSKLFSSARRFHFTERKRTLLLRIVFFEVPDSIDYEERLFYSSEEEEIPKIHKSFCQWSLNVGIAILSSIAINWIVLRPLHWTHFHSSLRILFDFNVSLLPLSLSLSAAHNVIEPPANLDAPGEMGRPVNLPANMSAETKKLVDEGWLNNAFNQYASDLISVHRSLPDPRDEWWVRFSFK